ncbi:MAG: hypothetical protein LBH89_03330 [Lactococcus lactis]|nr:hypothetical protein [Lactococcus lactis]
MTVLVSLLSSSVIAGLITSFFQGRQDTQSFSRDISKKLLENVFSKFHFEFFAKIDDSEKMENIKVKLKEFIKYIDKNGYSGYIIELYNDAFYAEKAVTLLDFSKQYNQFRRRYYNANLDYRKRSGIRSVSKVDDMRIAIFPIVTGTVLVSIFYPMLLASLLNKLVWLEKISIIMSITGTAVMFLGLLIMIFVLISEIMSLVRIGKEKKKYNNIN